MWLSSSLALFLGASALGVARASTDPDERQTTVFNGQKVPALLELTPDNFDATVKGTKNLVVKYFRYEQAIVSSIILHPTGRFRNVCTLAVHRSCCAWRSYNLFISYVLTDVQALGALIV